MRRGLRLDRVLDDLEDALKGEEGADKPSRTLFKVGRRSARRGVAIAPVEELLRGAIQTVTAGLVEQMLLETIEKETRRSQVVERISRLEAIESPAAVGSPISASVGPRDLGPVRNMLPPERTKSRDLASAADYRRAHREQVRHEGDAKQAQLQEEAKLARQQADVDHFESVSREIESLRDEEIALRESLEQLPAVYGQRFTQVKERGNVMLARFGEGFEEGWVRIPRPFGLTRKGRERARRRYEIRRSNPRPNRGFVVQAPAAFEVDP